MLIFLTVNNSAAEVTVGHQKWLFVVLETKPGALGLLHKCSTTELHAPSLNAGALSRKLQTFTRPSIFLNGSLPCRKRHGIKDGSAR